MTMVFYMVDFWWEHSRLKMCKSIWETMTFFCVRIIAHDSRLASCANRIQVLLYRAFTIRAVCTSKFHVHTNALCVEHIRHKTQTTNRKSEHQSTSQSCHHHHNIIMKQQRQPNSSSSRLATALLLSIALPYLLFFRCSADESSSLIIDRRATGLKEKQLQRRLNKIN